MNFKAPTGKISDDIISKEYEEAPVFDKIRVGTTGVFFAEGFSVKYIPYSYMERAFLRINEVNGKLCCGNANFYYYRIVFVHDGKEFADVLSEKEEQMKSALAAISASAPNVAIGYVK